MKILGRESDQGCGLRGGYKISRHDTIIVAYPKSGSTWLRFMIGNYISNNRCDFTNYHFLVPDIHHNPYDCNRLRPPRIIKSHEPFTPEYYNVIYLARDGRDVAVSMFHHLKKYRMLPFETPFDVFIPQFNEGSVSKFGTWVEHVSKWINNVPQNFLLIKYENMRLDPISSLKKVLIFAGIRLEEERIASAVRASDFSNMKRAEVEQYKRCDTLIGSDKRIQFVRNAEVGEWRKYFSEEMQRGFVRIHGSALNALSYDISCNSLDLPGIIHREE